VELLKEIAPPVTRVAALFNPAMATFAEFWLKPFKAAAASFAVEASVPGIGPIIATALAATVVEPSSFRSGREFAAWLGLVPRQHSTGGKHHLDIQARQPIFAPASDQRGQR
jgi:hypothetical protein